MGEPKLLAEWFWTDRYDGSSAALMSMECQGVYRSMLSRAWRAGARLPNDHEAIQRAIRCTPDEWARCWPKVSRYWRVEGDNLVNDTQLEVYAEALASQQRASDRGKAGAEARARARTQAQAQALAQVDAQAPPKHPLEHKPPSPSPSPSPVSVSGRTDERTDGRSAKPNPFIADLGGKDAAALEALRLVREICALTGEDGAEVMAEHARYEGAAPGRQKTNPANMTDDRLVNTILDLRATLKAEREKRAGTEPAGPPDLSAVPALAAEFVAHGIRSGETLGQALTRWKLERGIAGALSVAVSQRVRELVKATA